MKNIYLGLVLIALVGCTAGETDDEQTQEELSLKGYITSNIFSLTQTLNSGFVGDYESRVYRLFNLTPESFYTEYGFADMDYDIPSINTAGLTWNQIECYKFGESEYNNGYIGEESEDLITYVTDRYTFELRRSPTGLLFKQINNTSGSAISSNWTLSDQETLNNDIASRPSGICITE